MNGRFFWRDNADIVLSLTIQPKSSADQLVGEYNGRCKIRTAAPPVNGKANTHLIKYLAELFRVSKSQVIIEKGATSRHKQVRIINPAALPSVFCGIENTGDQASTGK